MLESGVFIQIRFQHEARNKKAYRYSLAAGVPKIPGVARAPSSRNIPSERRDCSTGGGRVTLAIYGLERR
jgi:hypothetical protein